MAVAVWDIGLMYLAELEQRSSGEVSIERDQEIAKRRARSTR
jgi:hypothetical protein